MEIHTIQMWVGMRKGGEICGPPPLVNTRIPLLSDNGYMIHDIHYAIRRAALKVNNNLYVAYNLYTII